MEILNSQEGVKEIIKGNDMVLVYFGNSSCGVCTDMKPKVESMVRNYSKIKSIYIDADKSKKIAIGYNVFTIPAILFFVEGKETIREARYISILDLEKKISRYYNFLV